MYTCLDLLNSSLMAIGRRRIVLQLDFDEKLDTVYKLNEGFERWAFENSGHAFVTAKDVFDDNAFKHNGFSADPAFFQARVEDRSWRGK
ncbi:hypothetical protein NU219Hw_g2702t1 [Hortaea werneckii]